MKTQDYIKSEILRLTDCPNGNNFALGIIDKMVNDTFRLIQRAEKNGFAIDKKVIDSAIFRTIDSYF